MSITYRPAFAAASIAAILTGWLGVETVRAQQAPADIVLTNGKIITVDDRFTIAQAVAIKGDRIVAVDGQDVSGQSVGATNATNDGSRKKCSGLAVTPLNSADTRRRFDTSGAVRSLRSRSTELMESRNACEAPHPENMMCPSTRANKATPNSTARNSR